MQPNGTSQLFCSLNLSSHDAAPRPGPGARRGQASAALRALVVSVSAQPEAAGLELASLVAACDQDELVELAISQGAAGRASERLVPLLAAAQRARLISQVRRDAIAHVTFLGLLDQFARALEEVGVVWVVLKGPVLAEVSYGHTTRGYADLDLMVPARQLGPAIQVVGALGAVFADRNWPLLVREATGELMMAFRGLPLLDLHWHLVNKYSARQRFAIPSDEVLERRRRAQLGAMNAWVLEPTDFAVHVALHASFSGAHELRWLLDVERTLANQPPDWGAFVARCHAWRVGLPVCVALSRAQRTVGAQVPEGLLQELAGGLVRRLAVRPLEVWVPSGHLAEGRSLRNGVTRSFRDGLAATVADFAGESLHTLNDLCRHRTTRPDGPGNLSFDSGGLTGLERYLELVGLADRYGHLSKRKIRGLALSA